MRRSVSDPLAPREWRFYIADMISSCDRDLRYTHGVDQAEFVADTMRFDATVRNLELIGEAATHVPQPVRCPFRMFPGVW
jgi:uncharacterized protein with HEPN domain